VETAPKTDVMAFLLPVTNRPGRCGRIQVHRRAGERSSPDSSDLPAIYGITLTGRLGKDSAMTGVSTAGVARRAQPGQANKHHDLVATLANGLSAP
jgi:hypothetical protein